MVSGSLIRQRVATTAELLSAFYARRVLRLTPALAACVLVTSVALSVLLSPEVAMQLDEYYEAGQFGLVGWANNHFAARGTAYHAVRITHRARAHRNNAIS